MHSTTQPFPKFHTDAEWGIFNSSDGFQIWYLYENDEYIGNMFLLETEHVLPCTNLHFGCDDSVELRQHTTITNPITAPIKTFHRYNDLHHTVKYLNMRPGECIIFNKNLYHRSDHRISKYRHAISFRVIIADTDGGISVDYSTRNYYHTILNNALRTHNIKQIDDRIFPKMFDLL
jgi:hypothetical protein